MEAFEIVGDLCLKCQEGGFASDAFVILDPNPQQDPVILFLASPSSNLHPCGRGLDNLVAEHFGCARKKPSGDRHVGMVRITIERIEE